MKVVEHGDMLEWYKNNPEVIEFILDFFNLKNGIRTRAIHDIAHGRAPVLYCKYDKKCLIDIRVGNFWEQMEIAGTVHFREYIYHRSVRSWINKDTGKEYLEGYDFEDRRIGCSLVFDIDAPSIPVETRDGKGGVTVEDIKIDILNDKVFDKGNRHKYFEDMNKAKLIVENEFEEMGWDWVNMWSGNGVYLVKKPYYPDLGGMSRGEINYFWDIKYATKVREIVDDINVILDNSGVKSMIDVRWKAWSLYHKIPFTYHGTKNRISIPISKGEMEYGYIENMSNGENLGVLSGKEIINNADWI